MTIEITRPEVEALIQQQLQSGDFATLEDVILEALLALVSDKRTGAELVEAMQASPFREVEIEPKRERSPVRDVAF